MSTKYVCGECAFDNGGQVGVGGNCKDCGAPLEDSVPVAKKEPVKAQTPKQAQRYYCYISFLTPLGPGAYYYNGDKHPLHPEAHEAGRKKIATELSLQTIKQGGIVATDSIVYLTVLELPIDVARAKWPEEFE